MSAATRKYLFDADFASGADRKPSEPTITVAEHETRLAAAEVSAHGCGYAAAQSDATVESDRRIAAALERVAAELATAAAALGAIETRLECEAVDVAVAVARKLAPALIEREPFAEIAALAGECFRQLVTAPHLVVRVNDAQYAAAREKLDQIARGRGFEGRLVVLAEGDVAVGDCRIEWADGGVNRNNAAAIAAIGEAVTSYVSARRSFAGSSEMLRRRENE